MESELLYESKGAKTKLILIEVICGVFFLAIAIWLFALSGMKHEGIRVSVGGRTGTLGGGALFSEEMQNTLRILGFLILLAAAFVLEFAIAMKRCWLRVYADHVEGLIFRYGFQKNQFHLPYTDVHSVQLLQNAIQIQAGGKSYKVFCQDEQKAFALLNQNMAAAKSPVSAG